MPGELKKGQCERCRKDVGFDSIDYCASCSKDLCRDCMEQGCCGKVPAVSGRYADDIVDDISDEDGT